MDLYYNDVVNSLEKDIPNPRIGQVKPTFRASYDSRNERPIYCQ
jgi:hypothetical protein